MRWSKEIDVDIHLGFTPMPVVCLTKCAQQQALNPARTDVYSHRAIEDGDARTEPRAVCCICGSGWDV
jgi:hypothetical protein